jgi:hypothetical protein
MSGRRWVMLGVLTGLLGCGGSSDDGPITTDEECKSAGGTPSAHDGVGHFCPAGEERIGGATWHGEIEGVSCCRPVRG